MRLALITASLAQGGAERVISILTDQWARQGKNITILVLNRGDIAAYPINAAVNVINLGLVADRSANPIQAGLRVFNKIAVLRRAIHKLGPDVLVSFMDYANILTLLTSRRLGIPVIVSERIDPSLYRIGTFWEIARRITYPGANAVVCQTEATLGAFQRRFSFNGYVIPNPVIAPGACPTRKPELSGDRTRCIMAMGRLVPQKGFDLLIEAFSRVAKRHPNWALTIAGGGPLKDDLMAQSERLGLTGRVALTGPLQDPFPALAGADLFVLSSRFEGFPNALCEAMACGVPVISFDCPSGPREIIRDNVDGILVPPADTAALASALDRLMASPADRARLAARAPEITARFSVEHVLSLWDDLFRRVIVSKPQTGQQ